MKHTFRGDKPLASQPVQLIWGIALVLMGLAFFFRISEIMDRIAGIEHFASVRVFLRIGFYLMGIILVGGGVQKILGFWRCTEKKETGEKK